MLCCFSPSCGVRHNLPAQIQPMSILSEVSSKCVLVLQNAIYTVYPCPGMMVHSLCGSRTDYNEDESLKTQIEGTMEDHNIEIHDFSDAEKARTVHKGLLNPTCGM